MIICAPETYLYIQEEIPRKTVLSMLNKPLENGGII